MSEVVFILGAGASKDCGAPLMNDFLDTASRILSTNEAGDKKEDFERVFKVVSALQSVHSKAQLDLNNIESIFTSLEIANILQKLPGFRADEIPLAIASLKELIVVTLEETIKFPIYNDKICPTSSYERFSNLLRFLKEHAHPRITPTVITFNYDIALDFAMYKNGIEPVYGFEPPVNPSDAVKLLKLHGSLNWAVHTDSKSIQPLTLQEYLSRYGYNGYDRQVTYKIRIGSQLQQYYSYYTKVKVDAEPVIVPPSWNKADNHQLVSVIWETAARELEEAEYIFIIGYSLPETDAFFRLLYGLGTVGDKLLKKVIIYNPDESGVIKDRFRNMMGPGALARFEYKPLKFDQSIEDIESFFPEQK